MERVKGIEPSYSAWEADVLPLNYTRISEQCYYTPNRVICQAVNFKKHMDRATEPCG